MMVTRKILAILAVFLVFVLSCKTIGGGVPSPTAPPATLPTQTAQAQPSVDATPGGQPTVKASPVAPAPSPTPVSGSQPSQSNPASDSLPNLVDSGAVSIQNLSAAMEETIGEVLEVQVTNDSQQPITVTIPCGLVFDPVGGELQPLMVFQEASASLAPGEQASLSPQVACVDVESGVPELSAEYQVGDMAQGDLLQLAQCLCEQEIDLNPEAMDLMSVQFAIWQVSNGDVFSDLPETPLGPLNDILENSGMSPEDLAAIQQVFTMFSGDWLERCNLNPTPSP